MRYHQLNWAFLVILTFIASFFMFYQLGKIPPLYPWSDEASAGQDALATLNGAFHLYYPDQGGGGNLWIYLATLAFWLIEPNLLTLRWLTGLTGVLSVLWLYGASTELLRTFMLAKRAKWLSFLAATWMAGSAWHIIMSRVAWPPVVCPLVMSAVTLFLWRGLRTARLHNFIGLGIFLGLSFYLYVPCRFIMAVPLVFLGLETVISLRRHQIPRWWQLRRQFLVAAGVTLLVAAPMLGLFITNPRTFTARIEEIEIQADRSFAGELAQSLSFHADVFGLTLNLQRSPLEGLILGNITTVLFWLGIIIALWRLPLPANRYLIMWWFLLIIPGIAAPALERGLPELRRIIGSLPATFIFSALAVEWAMGKGQAWLSSVKPLKQATVTAVVAVIAASIVIITAWQASYDFFVIWPTTPSYTRFFNPVMVNLVNWTSERTTPNTTFIFPIRAIRMPSSYPWIHSMRFLYKGSASYVPNNEPDVPEALVAAIKGKSDVYLLVEKQADPKGQYLYLLKRLGTLVKEEKVFGFEVKQFALQRWQLEEPAQSLKTDIGFGSVLRLRGTDLGLSTDAARRLLWVELTWENLHSEADYQVVVKLKDQAGHEITQQDKLLLNNLYYQPTSTWTDGSIEKDYYLLEIPLVVLPGDYQLSVGVYDSQTLQNLLPTTQSNSADLTVKLGSIPVPPVQHPQEITPTIRTAAEIISGQLALVGFDSPIPDRLKPGATITLPCLFRADGSMPRAVQASLELLSPEQSWTLSAPVPIEVPANWPATAPFRLFIDGRIPRTISSGKYSLALVVASDNNQLNKFPVSEVEIVTRSHQFEIPSKAGITPKPVSFGEVAQLQGYSLDRKQTHEANQQVVLTLYWQARQETDVSYKVFVHLLDSNDQIVTQIDRGPQSGEAPTTSWLTGEIITDTFEFPADEKLAQVTAIAIGLYDPSTGKRLPVSVPDGQTESQLKIILKK